MEKLIKKNIHNELTHLENTIWSRQNQTLKGKYMICTFLVGNHLGKIKGTLQ